jgi:hypothetical protein
MRISTKIIKPLIYGTWILRNTNDLKIDDAINYLIINNDKSVKFKSLDYNYFFGIKNSRSAIIENITDFQNNSYKIDFKYFKKNTYTYSFFGIEIPEIKTKSEEYYKQKNLTLNLYNNVLLIFDNEMSIYYVFDLYLGKIKYPNIETQFNTFIFTQIFGILIGILINKLLN